MKKNLLSILIIFGFFLNCTVAQNPGDIYEDFGSDGIATWDWFGYEEHISDMAIQEDDKIVLAGRIMLSDRWNVLVVRLTAEGFPDFDFGISGSTAFYTETINSAYSLTIQENGKIVLVLGHTGSSDVAVARLTENGQMDYTFSDDGIADISDYVQLLNSEQRTDVIVNDENEIFVAGGSYDIKDHRAGTIVSLTPYGSINSDFGVDGLAKLTVEDRNSMFTDIAFQEDGKLLATGIASEPMATFRDVLIGRFNPNGISDYDFGDNGAVVIDNYLSEDQGHDVLQDDNDDILVTGVYSNDDFFIVRLLPNGLIDNTFNGGLVTLDLNIGADHTYSICQQEDGKYTIAGYAETESDAFDFLLVRFDQQGYLDDGFGDYGIVYSDIDGNDDYAYAVDIHSDLNIVVAGEANDNLVAVKYYSGLYVDQKEISPHSQNIQLYPNPVNDDFYIKIPSNINNVVQVQIFSSKGKLLYKKQLMANNDLIHITDFQIKRGVYIVNLNSGKINCSSKLLIK